jgi:hypothetical protein
MTPTHTRRAAATIISAAVALAVLTAPATAQPPEHLPTPPADQRPTTTTPAMRPSKPSDAPRLAYGSDLERLYLTSVGAFTAATLIGFFTTTVAKHRRRRARQPQSAKAVRGVHLL